MSKPWRPSEDAYLHENAGILSLGEMADHLGRSVSSVDSRLQAHGGQRRIEARRKRREKAAIIASIPGGGLAASRALAASTPSKPRGYDAGTLAWANEHPGHPEAQAIRAHHADWERKR